MESKRFIPILALQVDDKLIPVWELKYDDSQKDYIGVGYNVEGDVETYTQALIECIWDIKKGQIKDMLEIKINPNETEYKIGEMVAVDVDYRKSLKHGEIRIDEIVDITWQEDNTEYFKLKKIKKYYKKGDDQYSISVDIDTLTDGERYKVINMKPVYIMKDGEEIDYDHEIHSIQK